MIFSKSIFTMFLNYFSLWINILVINQGDEPENENAIIETQEIYFFSHGIAVFWFSCWYSHIILRLLNYT